MLLSNLYSNYITNAILKTEFNNKGDLLVADGENSVAVLPAGLDRQVLLSDSSQASGLRWALFEKPYYNYSTTTGISTKTFNATEYECYRIQIAHNTTINPTGSYAFGVLYRVVWHIINGGSATITWSAAIKWTGGSPPTFTTSGLDVVVFTTIDGGTTWQGSLAGLDYS